MKRSIFLSCLLLVFIFTTANAEPWVQTIDVLAHAEPDECYAGVGEDYPPGPPCDDGIPKTNQTYLWGLTRWGDSLWFGTGANVMCTTMGAFMSVTDPLITPDMVCEFGESQIARENASIPATLGDLRPPKVYEYDLITGILYDRTPDDPMIESSKGLRSAGSHAGVIFMAGGDLNDGITMFAFDAETKAYLGSRNFSGYQTIRKWLVVKNVLYTGVATPLGGGRILRWRGSRDNLWNFEEVGRVSGFPRELAEYIDASGRSRIAVSANGVWISPAIRWWGLTRWQARRWTEVWSPGEYEPDPMTLFTYGGGDLHYFGGWLYWATMHVPFWALDMHANCSAEQCYGEPTTEDEYKELLAGTHRAFSIWRARNLESDYPEVELLYGDKYLPAYDPATGTFVLTDTGWGQDDGTPRGKGTYGRAGFDNPYNLYGWTMEKADNHLFVGTSDMGPAFFEYFDVLGIPNEFGADLYRFDSANQPAEAEFYNGGGNSSNGGIRCLISSEDGMKLFVGTANNDNLKAEGGGWQLLRLNSLPAPP